MPNTSKTRRARRQPPPRSEAAAGGGYKGVGKTYDDFGNVLTGSKDESTESVRAKTGKPRILLTRKRGGKRGRLPASTHFKGPV